MKDKLKLITAIVLCQLVGILGSVFTRDAIPGWYNYIDKPSFAPPNWIFAPVWTTLYFLMGISFYLVWRQGLENKKVKTAVGFFLTQLFLNFIWSPIFFGLRSPSLGFINIFVMLIFIFITILQFQKLSKVAAYLLLPYFLWVTFATILNFSIMILNP